MNKVSFSKLYRIYSSMRNEVEKEFVKAKSEYQKNKTNENKKEFEVYKREFEMMNKVVNGLYYCKGEC